MRIEAIESPESLIEKLTELKSKDDYVFRGIANAKWKLEAKAFRENGKALDNSYPLASTELESWKKEALEKIRRLYNLPIYMLVNIINLCVFTMKYHYHLFKNVRDRIKENIKYISSEDDLIIRRYSNENPENIFIDRKYFDDTLLGPLLERIIPTVSLDGTVLKPSYPCEDLLNVMDASRPQHYDIPTSVLDWTYNPDVAIYFALDSEYADKNGDIFSIYAYKQIDHSENAPIKLIERHEAIENLRAERQEGLFSSLTMPCRFYIEESFFPSVETYDSQFYKAFELIKFNISRKACSNSLEKTLIEKNITKEFLFPD